MDGVTEKLCLQCHARLAANNPAIICPACGGPLQADVNPSLDPAGAPPREADHRGILLPRRHAVGGVITPR